MQFDVLQYTSTQTNLPPLPLSGESNKTVSLSLKSFLVSPFPLSTILCSTEISFLPGQSPWAMSVSFSAGSFDSNLLMQSHLSQRPPFAFQEDVEFYSAFLPSLGILNETETLVSSQHISMKRGK